MSNPLDSTPTELNDEGLTFFLQFNNIDSFGEVPIEITEPVKFDGATYIVEQDSERYGRDISFMNESIDLFFYKGFYDIIENPLMLPDGTIVYNLTMGYEQLIETRKRFGFEANVLFGIRKNGVDFILGNLDFENAETDEYSYISCKAIEDSAKSIIKAYSDINVDVFSDENLDGEEITPLQTFEMLLKAKPIVQTSRWSFLSDYWTETGSTGSGNTYVFGFNPIATNIVYGIDKTISFLDRTIEGPNNLNSQIYDTAYVSAQYDLTQNTIKLIDVSFSLFIPTGANYNDGWDTSFQSISFSGRKYLNDSNPSGSTLTDSILFKEWRNEETYTGTVYDTYSVIFAGNESVDRFSGYSGNADRYVITIPEITLNVADIPVNHRGSFYFSVQRYTGTNIIEWISGDTEMSSTSTAIDTIIKGVRYIDLFKQNVKSMNGFEVIAPRFDVGGEFYDQIAANGNLIKNRDDVSFYVTWKDLTETLKEVNADYQILDDNKVFIGQFPDFYANNEIAVLEAIPDDTGKTTFNQRFTLNECTFAYTNYETDDDEEDTIDSFQTSTQWLFPNKQVENVKDIQLKQIRDAFKIEKTRREAIKDTTATDEDYKLFLMDMVSLSPTAFNTVSITLNHNINGDGNLQLMNDASFSWLVIGVEVGDSNFELLDTGNAGVYTVLEISDSVITLSGGNIEGLNILTSLKYFYTGVNYTNRTNEGFTSIENILNPDKVGNLLYSIKRNLKNWYSYFATVGKYWQNKQLRNTEFINNGALSTMYGSETTPTVENANVDIVDFGYPILTDNIYTLRLVVDYETMVGVFKAMNTINEDDTLGGYIRTFNNNGKVLNLYPQKMEYEPATETLTLTGEEKYTSDILEISTKGNVISINRTAHEIDTTDLEWFEISNDYIILYDDNNLPITDEVRYDKVTVNGDYSTSPSELSQKLIDIS